MDAQSPTSSALAPRSQTIDTPGHAETARAVKALLARGDGAEARERFGDLVVRHQRRASRLAYAYLRDAADADEAVQDAFVKAFTRLGSYDDALPFEAWFTRILINGCLDRLKARARRRRWMVSLPTDGPGAPGDVLERIPTRSPSPEETLLAGEERSRIARAVGRLATRQRVVFGLSLVEGYSPREIGARLGISESTVRVHLFRAIRTLRSILPDTRSTLARDSPRGRHTALHEGAGGA